MSSFIFHFLIFFFLFFLIGRTANVRKNLEEMGAYTDPDTESPVSSTKDDSDATGNSTALNVGQKKDIQNPILIGRRKSDMVISQTSNSGDESPLEGSSVVHTKLPPGKVKIVIWNLSSN